MLTTCEHVEGVNPRLSGVCLKCGRTIPPDPEALEFTDDFRRQTLLEVAQKLGLEDVANRLADLAEQRTLDGPWRVRDFLWEWIEEAADGVGNYGPAMLALMLRDEDDDHERRAWIWEALHHGLLMQNALEKARAA